MQPSQFPIPQGTLDMLILQILSLEPAHGYGIAHRLERISNSVVQVNQGSVYPSLHRLEQRGWLKSNRNARAFLDEAGVDGKTPIFHAVTRSDERGFAMAELFLKSGADLWIQIKLPGHYQRPDELERCTALGYALLFPGSEYPGANEKTVQLLREKAGRSNAL